MLRGLYTSASGMSAQLIAQEVISNNLANANTTGYKKDMAVNNAFNQLVISRVNDPSRSTNSNKDLDTAPVIGVLGTGVQPAGTFTDYANGALQQTENPFDVAISGDGFFVIQTPQGERYTRDGSFTINTQGDLVTKDGYTVVGRRGNVNVGAGENLSINTDGSVIANGSLVNELMVVIPENKQSLHKVGNNLYAVNQGGAVKDAEHVQVAQGYLETSNVNVVSEMVNMLSGLRIYEANQKAIQMQDQSLGLLISDIARV